MCVPARCPARGSLVTSHVCTFFPSPFYSNSHAEDIDTFNVPKRTDAIIALSQSDTRFYSVVQSAAEWSFDFKLFKKGSDRVLGSSSYSYGRARSVTLNIELQPGDYVVHVRTALPLCFPLKLSLTRVSR